MIGKRFRSLPFIFANDNYTLSIYGKSGRILTCLNGNKLFPAVCLNRQKKGNKMNTQRKTNPRWEMVKRRCVAAYEFLVPFERRR